MFRPHPTGLALAITLAILWVVCSLLYAVAPVTWLSFAATLFHGFQMISPPPPMTLTGFLLGFFALAVAGYVGGWLFASLYRAIDRSPSA